MDLTDQFLNSKRTMGDLKADAVIRTVAKSGGGAEEIAPVTDLLHQLALNDDTIPAGLPPVAKDYFKDNMTLPRWADPAKIEIAQDFYTEHGVEIGVILLCSSLPFCYADASGVQVLARSGQLTDFVPRRLNETTRFMLDVMQAGNLAAGVPGAAGALGIEATLKIRLLHATMRYYFSNQPNPADRVVNPINQEDLAMTLMTFSVVVLDGLARLNFPATKEQQEAYFHAWNVIGFFLGVDDDLRAADVDEGRELFKAVGVRQFRVSKEGQDVTLALVTFLQHIVPGRLFNELVPMMLHFLLTNPVLLGPGIDVATILNITESPVIQKLEPVIRFLYLALQTVTNETVCGLAARDFGRHLLLGLELVNRGGNRAFFHVPDSLRKAWKIPS